MDLQQMQQYQPPTGNPPMLGADNPVTSNTSPAQSGLSVLANPLAKQLQSYGRGDDSVLVHMTPNEVNSLQGLAMATGGSLTINPHTGLPEAGWLGKLLPTLLGAGLTFIPGIGPLAAAGIVGAGQTALTGSLQKGLLAGLGAFGGASLAGALAPTAAGGAASNLVAQNAAKIAAEKGAVTAAQSAVSTAGTEVAKQAAQKSLEEALKAQVTKAPGFLARFGAEAGMGLTGIAGKAAPMLAGLGLTQNLSNAFTPSMGGTPASGRPDNSYQGPYTWQKREATFAPSTEDLLNSSAERDYFKVDQPEVYNTMGQITQAGSNTAPGTPILQSYLLEGTGKKKDKTPLYGFREVPYMMSPEDYAATLNGSGGMSTGYAEGGEVALSDGAFVMDARSVSELGNGSSGAGQELLARLGGRPIRGPGDGVSDSVPARIGRDQPARVARDEVVFPAEAVRQIGAGDQNKGAKKLYALMDKAHKARKKAGRGKDTQLRRGLA